MPQRQQRRSLHHTPPHLLHTKPTTTTLPQTTAPQHHYTTTPQHSTTTNATSGCCNSQDTLPAPLPRSSSWLLARLLPPFWPCVARRWCPHCWWFLRLSAVPPCPRLLRASPSIYIDEVSLGLFLLLYSSLDTPSAGSKRVLKCGHVSW